MTTTDHDRNILSRKGLVEDTKRELANERDYAARKASEGRHRAARASLARVAKLEAWLEYLEGEFARVLADGQEAA